MVVPLKGSCGNIVNSSVQPKRPNHCDFALSLKSIRWLNWLLSMTVFCGVWRLLDTVGVLRLGRGQNSFIALTEIGSQYVGSM